jgi:hypothetical protein
MNRKELLILRTHVYSEYSFNLLKQLEEYFSILIIADTRKNNFCYPGFKQIEFSKANIDKLGLQCSDDMQWRCGDYAYYLALNEVEDFDYVWMIEPDVVFNFENVSDFFDNFTEDNSDLLITHFKEAQKNWYWYLKYKDVFDKDIKIYQALFALTRVSFNAINILYNNRKNIKETLNDEIFVTTTLKNNNLVVNDISHNKIFYTRKTFSFDYPIYFKNIKKINNMLYHPVFFNSNEFKKSVKKYGWIRFFLIKIHVFDFFKKIKYMYFLIKIKCFLKFW